jgi:hypothetical protein
MKSPGDRTEQIEHILQEKDQRIATLENIVESGNERIADLEQERSQLNAVIAALQSSLSWKITKPLRSVNGALKKGTVKESSPKREATDRHSLVGYARLAYRIGRHLISNHKSLKTSLKSYLDRHVTSGDAVQPAFFHDWLPTSPIIVYRPRLAPLNLVVDPALAGTPHLNVLIPSMAMSSMSGGPNTAINLTYRLAKQGIPLRYISTDAPLNEQDREPLWRHFSSLTGIAERYPHVQVVSDSNRTQALRIGENDVFFGTAWWTVQLIKQALTMVRNKKFIYLIQEFEPTLFPWSMPFALALETYDMNFHGIINEHLLAEYFCQNRIGRFANPEFLQQCAIFEPAVDRQLFHPEPPISQRKKKLLFYARPNAPRNLYDFGVLALKKVVDSGVFSPAEWGFFSIGENLPPIDLGNGMVIQPEPWKDYEGYARLLRNSDLGLSLMFSPHTSYPPLEMAASGMIVVTNTFEVKTAERLRSLSANIIPVAPELDFIVEGLHSAVTKVDDHSLRSHNSLIAQPTDWNEAFSELSNRLPAMFKDCLDGG